MPVLFFVEKQWIMLDSTAAEVTGTDSFAALDRAAFSARRRLDRMRGRAVWLGDCCRYPAGFGILNRVGDSRRRPRKWAAPQGCHARNFNELLTKRIYKIQCSRVLGFKVRGARQPVKA